MIEIKNIAATTEPFELGVGHYCAYVSGDFRGASATIEYQVHDRHHNGQPIYQRAGSDTFTDASSDTFTVAPSTRGNYRLLVAPGHKPPTLRLLIVDAKQPAPAEPGPTNHRPYPSRTHTSAAPRREEHTNPLVHA